MFCPECEFEYRDGFNECSVCNVLLVHELPLRHSEPSVSRAGSREFVDFEEVLFTFSPFDIAIIKFILDTEGITYFFKGEHFNYVRPLGEPARLMISIEQVREAKEILKDLDLTIGPAGMREEEEEG